MTGRIWASTVPDRLLVGTIAGFDELEIVSAETEFFDYPLFWSFGAIFSIVSIYYELDCRLVVNR